MFLAALSTLSLSLSLSHGSLVVLLGARRRRGRGRRIGLVIGFVRWAALRPPNFRHLWLIFCLSGFDTEIGWLELV
ncbi:hypothetical protein MUK42_34641 [Musa troglodytarum]|uniref:Secreted protein n=1 Tax=Musa troglodytarum TaxID=320322 RepID=A0A9E7J9E4_9LILI|nr:hypothetical protein MUK42_34641 [Musa troglodytarum]